MACISSMEMKDSIKKALSDRIRWVSPATGLTRAAVLVPLFQKEGHYHILFTKRTHRVKHHKGEISFPGGVVDEGDEDVEATACRETLEEIGLPRESVDILGRLDDAITISSAYLITPIVAEIVYPYPFSLNAEEIEELVEIPLEAFLEKERWKVEILFEGNERIHGDFFQYEGRIIWGATARIMRQFLHVLFPDRGNN